MTSNKKLSATNNDNLVSSEKTEDLSALAGVPVCVENKNKKRSWYGFMLWLKGLHYAGKGRYLGTISKKKYEFLKIYCKNRHLRCVINNDYGQRSNSYRKEFFEKHHPSLLGRYYFCVYCGIPVTKKKMTVDHLIPVHRAETSLKMQKKLQKRGYDSINDPKNLVPACRRCNTRKGTKMGLWIVRGKIGRIQAIWYPIWAVRVVLFIGLVYFLFRLLNNSGLV